MSGGRALCCRSRSLCWPVAPTDGTPSPDDDAGRAPMRSPKVSIGLPVFNGQAYLKGAIVSILEQDYQDLELIICDNASTDETESLCREFARTDPRVRYYRNDSNIGFANNTRRVFELANG